MHMMMSIYSPKKSTTIKVSKIYRKDEDIREGSEFGLSKRNEKVLEEENSKRRRNGMRSCVYVCKYNERHSNA